MNTLNTQQIAPLLRTQRACYAADRKVAEFAGACTADERRERALRAARARAHAAPRGIVATLLTVIFPFLF